MLMVTSLGLNLDLIYPDASLYASIAKTMVLQNDYVNLYFLGDDWLDKPHLPFWLTAISFKIFGFSNFAYKIPAILVFYMGVLYTFKFAKNNYNIDVAWLSVLILITSFHSVLSNFDVRAEPYLTGFIITATYYFDVYIKKNKFKHLVLATLFAAFAVMTKGLFALMPIVFGFGLYFILQKKWKELFSFKWIIATFLLFIFIIPELYCLYVQFDLHPEKIVFGQKNVSGIKFFFWDSQFGRFLNSGPIKGNGSIFFFLHTILWAFFPWAIVFYVALINKLESKVQLQKTELITIFGTLGTILIFSLSKFQLAHYTNIVFPFMAIVTANFLNEKRDTIFQKKWFLIQYWFQIVLVIAAICFVIFLKLKVSIVYFISIGFLIFIKFWLYKLSIYKLHAKLFNLVLVSVFFYGFLFTVFYKTILKYQANVMAAKFVNEHFDGKATALKTNKTLFDFDFYTDKTTTFIDLNEIEKSSKYPMYVSENELNIIKENHIQFDTIQTFSSFHISKLSIKFLNEKTRESTLEKKYLIKIK